jgi:hypothetical protein
VGYQGIDVLSNRVPDVSFGFFHSPSVAEAAGNSGAIGEVAVVFHLFLDDYFRRIVFHFPFLRRSLEMN